jgi:hypothetical protein
VTLVVKVTFKPWDEVIVHEEIHYSLEDLIKLNSIGVQPGGLAHPLRWAEGVVFRFVSMTPTDEIIKEQLQGRVHWNAVEWALMPQYKNVIPIQDINAKIPVINVSSATILCDVAKALKEKAKSSLEETKN